MNRQNRKSSFDSSDPFDLNNDGIVKTAHNTKISILSDRFRVSQNHSDTPNGFPEKSLDTQIEKDGFLEGYNDFIPYDQDVSTTGYSLLSRSNNSNEKVRNPPITGNLNLFVSSFSRYPPHHNQYGNATQEPQEELDREDKGFKFNSIKETQKKTKKNYSEKKKEKPNPATIWKHIINRSGTVVHILVLISKPLFLKDKDINSLQKNKIFQEFKDHYQGKIFDILSNLIQSSSKVSNFFKEFGKVRENQDEIKEYMKSDSYIGSIWLMITIKFIQSMDSNLYLNEKKSLSPMLYWIETSQKLKTYRKHLLDPKIRQAAKAELKDILLQLLMEYTLKKTQEMNQAQNIAEGDYIRQAENIKKAIESTSISNLKDISTQLKHKITEIFYNYQSIQNADLQQEISCFHYVIVENELESFVKKEPDQIGIDANKVIVNSWVRNHIELDSGEWREANKKKALSWVENNLKKEKFDGKHNSNTKSQFRYQESSENNHEQEKIKDFNQKIKEDYYAFDNTQRMQEEATVPNSQTQGIAHEDIGNVQDIRFSPFKNTKVCNLYDNTLKVQEEDTILNLQPQGMVYEDIRDIQNLRFNHFEKSEKDYYAFDDTKRMHESHFENTAIGRNPYDNFPRMCIREEAIITNFQAQERSYEDLRNVQNMNFNPIDNIGIDHNPHNNILEMHEDATISNLQLQGIAHEDIKYIDHFLNF